MENREICYHNYYINQIKIVLKIDGEVYNFKGYRNEKDLICISNPKEFLEKSGYKVYNNSDNSNYEIEKNNIKIKISKVSCTEFKRTVPFLLNNIYLGEFCEKTDFDFKKVDEKTYIVFNLESLRHMGLNWNDEKLKTAFFIRKNLKNNFEIEFICALIGNVVNEGNFGYFESSNYKTYPSNKPEYLRHMDNHHNYRELASGKNIMDLGIGIFDKLDTKYRNECTGFKENENSCAIICKFSGEKCLSYSEKHKFGFGCVQWTAPNRLKVIIGEYKKLGNIKPSLEQCIKIEINYIKYEFQNIDQYKKIYNEWKNKTLNFSSSERVIEATKEICYKYEIPKNKEYKLPSREKDALDWLKVIEENIY